MFHCIFGNAVFPDYRPIRKEISKYCKKAAKFTYVK